MHCRIPERPNIFPEEAYLFFFFLAFFAILFSSLLPLDVLPPVFGPAERVFNFHV